MAPIAVGDVIPDGKLTYFDENDQLQNVSLHSIAAGKKIVLFGVPGAFTPTLNDPYVMKAWAKTYPENEHVKFLADVSAIYIHALGLELDLVEKGLGTRSRRFGLLVDDLKVKIANIESGGELKAL